MLLLHPSPLKNLAMALSMTLLSLQLYYTYCISFALENLEVANAAYILC